jgi:hypothetical protein
MLGVDDVCARIQIVWVRERFLTPDEQLQRE